MRISVSQGVEAERLMEEEAFTSSWNVLYAQCPWATVMQSHRFLRIWYLFYRSDYELLLIAGVGARGLVGLLPLAIHKRTGRLVAAGDSQSEYQTWLASPESVAEFVPKAFAALRTEFHGHALRFLFLAPSTPLGWLKSRHEWTQRCELRPMRRPLMDIGDGERFRQSLRNKDNRYRVKQLERYGQISFARIAAPEQLGELFGEITTYGSFRLSAIHNVRPTGEDPLKQAFLVALMRDLDLVHATVLNVGDRMASAQVNIRNGNEVILGTSTHSPFFARYSPSSFHILLLGIDLAQEGIATLDLTPGGEYKDRHATHHDVAHVLTVFFERSGYVRHQVKRSMVSAGKTLLDKSGIGRSRAFELADLVRHKLTRLSAGRVAAASVMRIRQRFYDSRETRIYALDTRQISMTPMPTVPEMRRDCIADLLKYDPTESWQPTVSQFHREALKRIERGYSVYTFVERERLLHFGWLIRRQEKSFLSEVGQDFYPAPNTVMLFDFHTHTSARGRGLYQQAIREMLQDAARIAGTTLVYISVLADNAPSRHVIEKAGFVYQFSFFREVRCGRVRRWSNAPEEATRPRTARKVPKRAESE